MLQFVITACHNLEMRNILIVYFIGGQISVFIFWRKNEKKLKKKTVKTKKKKTENFGKKLKNLIFQFFSRFLRFGGS